MVRNLDTVRSLLFGTKTSDFKVGSIRDYSYQFYFLYDERNPDFKRNSFHVPVEVSYSEGTADWQGNIKMHLNITIGLGITRQLSNRDEISQKSYYFHDVCRKNTEFNSNGRIKLDLNNYYGHFYDPYLKGRLDPNYIKDCVCLLIESDKYFASDRELAQFIEKAVGFLFKPEHYSKTMDFMFSLARFWSN